MSEDALQPGPFELKKCLSLIVLRNDNVSSPANCTSLLSYNSFEQNSLNQEYLSCTNENKASEPFEMFGSLRRFSCSNYNLCLSLGAALNWVSFSCEGCNGNVNAQLIWKAHQRLKPDLETATLCGMEIRKELKQHCTAVDATNELHHLKVVGK